jgi:hypothetical protein
MGVVAIQVLEPALVLGRQWDCGHGVARVVAAAVPRSPRLGRPAKVVGAVGGVRIRVRILGVLLLWRHRADDHRRSLERLPQCRVDEASTPLSASASCAQLGTVASNAASALGRVNVRARRRCDSGGRISGGSPAAASPDTTVPAPAEFLVRLHIVSFEVADLVAVPQLR